MAEKMTDVNRMIRELEEADIDDDGVCVRYFPYKRDVPILVNALKMYRGFMAENKMAEVAALFGKELDEEFCVSCCNTRFLLKFTSDGLWVFDDSWGHWNGEDGMLEALLAGEAIVDE